MKKWLLYALAAVGKSGPNPAKLNLPIWWEAGPNFTLVGPGGPSTWAGTPSAATALNGESGFTGANTQPSLGPVIDGVSPVQFNNQGGSAFQYMQPIPSGLSANGAITQQGGTICQLLKLGSISTNHPGDFLLNDCSCSTQVGPFALSYRKTGPGGGTAFLVAGAINSSSVQVVGEVGLPSTGLNVWLAVFMRMSGNTRRGLIDIRVGRGAFTNIGAWDSFPSPSYLNGAYSVGERYVVQGINGGILQHITTPDDLSDADCNMIYDYWKKTYPSAGL